MVITTRTRYESLGDSSSMLSVLTFRQESDQHPPMLSYDLHMLRDYEEIHILRGLTKAAYMGAHVLA